MSAKGAALIRTGFADDVCQVPVPAGSESSALPPMEVVPDVPVPATDAPLEENPPLETSATQESAPDQVAEVSTSVEASPATDESSASSRDDVPNDDAPSGVQSSSDIALESAPAETGTTESVPDAGSLSEPAAETSPPPASAPSVSRALAESLELVDSNGDGRFDFADVRYSENLSGTADPSEYFLYSNT